MKIIIIGAGPVGALAAIYAAQRGHMVEVYELRDGKMFLTTFVSTHFLVIHLVFMQLSHFL